MIPWLLSSRRISEAIYDLRLSAAPQLGVPADPIQCRGGGSDADLRGAAAPDPSRRPAHLTAQPVCRHRAEAAGGAGSAHPTGGATCTGSPLTANESGDLDGPGPPPAATLMGRRRGARRLGSAGYDAAGAEVKPLAPRGSDSAEICQDRGYALRCITGKCTAPVTRAESVGRTSGNNAQCTVGH